MNKFLTFAMLMCLSTSLFAQSGCPECVPAFEKEEYRTAFGNL